MKKVTQTDQVIEALRKEGGFATLKRLNEILDFSKWKSQTPEASVRRIVQDSEKIFKIRPGLWALEEARDKVLQKLQISEGNKISEEQFSHGYYQGLLVEIGKYLNLTTYVPAQDKGRLFLGKPLCEVSDCTVIPPFTYDTLFRKARTIDVIWFNHRMMPTDFYEVEHTTDIKNSLAKFYELQDFFAKFHIVADKHRETEFKDKLNVSMFQPIYKRVRFIDYERVAQFHSALRLQKNFSW